VSCDTYKTLLLGRGVFILALLLGPALSGAQEVTDIGEIEVSGTQRYESLESPGSFTTVITPEKFAKGSADLGEILRRSAGIDVKYTGGEGQVTTVSIRGSSAEQVAVFLDGIRLNSATFGIVDFSTIPVESIERIEVLRGGASARFGTDAIGGVINIVTKRAGAKRVIDLKLTGGSFNTLKTAESWREPGDRTDFVLAHSHRSTGGDFTFTNAKIIMAGQPFGRTETYTRLHNQSIAEDVLAKIGIRLNDTMRISFANSFFWTDRQVPGMEEETTVLYPANPLEAEEEIFRDTVSAIFTADEFFSKNLSFETGATYFMDHDYFTDPSPAVGNPIDVTYLNQSPQWHARFMHSLSTAHASLASTARYNLRYDRSSDSSPRAGANLMGTKTRITNTLMIEETAGFFDDRLFVIPQASFEKATKRSFCASWRMGLVAKPESWIELKSNVGRSHRYPNFGELYFPDQGYLRGNPDLLDEKALNWDAGFIIKPKYVSLETSYFQNRIDNMIVFVPISATTIQPVNTFEAFIQGIEIQVAIDPFKYLGISGNYTWLDAHYAGSSRSLPGRPKHTANFHIEGRISPIVLFADIYITGGYPVNTANTVYISGNTSVDAGATLTFAKHFFATAEAKDLGNVQRYDRLSFPLPRRSYQVTLGAKI